MRAFFVTGTDTGVGKTAVSVSMLRAAAGRGLRAAGMKPVETGCRRGEDGELVGEDAGRLAAASALALPREVVCPYRFAEPAAPAVAAGRDELAPRLDVIERSFAGLVEAGPDLVVVEGAGGLLVPVRSGVTMADVARALGLPLVVVARDGLGTINHTLLTLEAAAGRGLEVAGVVLNGARPGVAAARVRSNVEVLQGAGVRVIAWAPYGEQRGTEILDALMS